MPNKRAQRAPPSEKLKPRPVNVRFYAMIGSTPTCEPSSMLLIRVATLTNHWILYLANRHLTCMQREARFVGGMQLSVAGQQVLLGSLHLSVDPFPWVADME